MALSQPGQSVLFISAASHERKSRTKSLIDSQSILVELDFDEIGRLASLGDSKFDVIVSLADNSSRHTQPVLSDAWKVLKPSGSLKLAEDFNRTFDHSSALSSALTLSGFTQQQNTELDGIVFVTSQKPNYTSGASHAIKLKKKPAADPWSEPSSNGAALVDESTLLSAADLAKPVLQDDCEVGKTKKACKNCSCGRAEMEAGEEAKPKKVTLAMLDNPAVNSSCGSCSLGDAFRCGGCPYRGLPAFKPGEKIVLPDDFDMDLIEG